MQTAAPTAIGLLPIRVWLADAHGQDQAAAAGEDDPLLARPADQPDQRGARPPAMVAQIRILPQARLRHASRPSSRASRSDPAMMIYLNIEGSERDAPNENYARELMELFALGVGNFSEKDVREAARAFTGWQVPRERGGRRQVLPQDARLPPAGVRQGHEDGLRQDAATSARTRSSTSSSSSPRRRSTSCDACSRSSSTRTPRMPTWAIRRRLHKVRRSIRATVEAMLRSDVFYSPRRIARW